jgi:hypothetical protein
MIPTLELISCRARGTRADCPEHSVIISKLGRRDASLSEAPLVNQELQHIEQFQPSSPAAQNRRFASSKEFSGGITPKGLAEVEACNARVLPTALKNPELWFVVSGFIADGNGMAAG